MRRSNSSSATAGWGLSLIACSLLFPRLLEHGRANHAGKQPVPAFFDARLELELLAHAVDPRVDLGNLGLRDLPGLPDVDGKRRSGPQPCDQIGRAHV